MISGIESNCSISSSTERSASFGLAIFLGETAIVKLTNETQILHSLSST